MKLTIGIILIIILALFSCRKRGLDCYTEQVDLRTNQITGRGNFYLMGDTSKCIIGKTYTLTPFGDTIGYIKTYCND